MLILDKFVAIGTQLKVERPGKAAAITACDMVHGPVVLLDDSSVRIIETIEEAKACKDKIKQILYLGDILFNYGDFSENGHILVPCGYNEDWYVQQLQREMKKQQEELGEEIKNRIRDPKQQKGFKEMLALSRKYNVPLHPRYTYYWTQITQQQFEELLRALPELKILEEKITIKNILSLKQIIELLGIPHLLISNEFIVIEKDDAEAFLFSLGIAQYEDIDKTQKTYDATKTVLENINNFAKIEVKDKAGTTIGARMGRPEKAKIRELTGSPHGLFPIGSEGGRLRSFQAALEAKKVTADFPLFVCPSCEKQSVHGFCYECNQKAKQFFFCQLCGKIPQAVCKLHGKAKQYKKQELAIETEFFNAIKYMQLEGVPSLIKGIKGTSNEDHVVEYIGKAILRAKYDVYVNKDGTIRYDMSELPLTHFKPVEVGTSVEKLREMGYKTDIEGKPLEHAEQVLEMYPQDVVLPAATDALDEPSDAVLFRTAQFIDDLLMRVYKQEPFYKLRKKSDLVGHLTICLAPHISAGMVGRIVGFSKTQGFFAHPLFHAALRRDCFTYDTIIPIYNGKCWKNWKIGELVEILHPEKKVDAFGTKEVNVEGYKTIGIGKDGNTNMVPVYNFTKHTPIEIIEVKTKTGRKIRVTKNHKFLVKKEKIEIRTAEQLSLGEKLILPKKVTLQTRKQKSISLLDIFKGRTDIVIRNVASDLKDKIKKSHNQISKETGIKYRDVRNYFYRDSIPLALFEKIVTVYNLDIKKLIKRGKISAKRDTVALPIIIELEESFMEYLGLYVAEGHSRYISSGKGCAQVYVAGFDNEVRNSVTNFGKKVNLHPGENKKDRVTFCSRVWYEIITKYLCCGSTAYKKRAPHFLLDADKKKIAAFLRGYFEGDGSVSISDKRVSCDSVSKELLQDIHLLLLRLGVFSRFYEYTKEPGLAVRTFYEKKGTIPKFTATKLTIPSNYVSLFEKEVGFISKRKKQILSEIAKRKGNGMKVEHDKKYVYDEIIEKNYLPAEKSYCLNVENNIVLANGILTRQCDGDEASVSLLLDGLLNFSRRYLPARIGARTMDAPLVLTSRLIPTEVDDQALGLDVLSEYPIELYEAAAEYQSAKAVKITQIKHRVKTPLQYEGVGFTHGTTNINEGVSCSAYKELPSMEDKLNGQMQLAVKIRAVNERDVARLVIEKHFLKDTKGNLRKFSQQKFRCVKCNESYRRPPLLGKCLKCAGKIIFTISEGSVIKYLALSIKLAETYDVSPYLKQTLNLLQRRVDAEFGKDKETQEALGKWFG